MEKTNIASYGASINELARSVRVGRITHALLFSGPEGTGKRTCAMYIARTLLCTHFDKPCGECSACVRVNSNSHPDLLVVSTEERTISVDTIREVKTWAGYKPSEGERKVVIINQAHKMTNQAQNALLKTLEEPVGNVVFILVSLSVGAMLSTIVSRCRNIRFSPLSADECAKVLRDSGIDAERASLLSALAEGSVGKALDINANDRYFDIRSAVIDALLSLKDVGGIAVSVKKLTAVKDERDTAVEILEVVARDLMARDNGVGPYADCAPINVSGQKLMLGVMYLRELLSKNVSWGNAVERMCYSLLI